MLADVHRSEGKYCSARPAVDRLVSWELQTEVSLVYAAVPVATPAARTPEATTLTQGANVSDDEQAAKELVETLKDGERGFASAAEKLRDGDRPEWATTLQRLSE